MIKYKLLKELPWIEVWTVFTVDDTKVRRKDWYNSTNYVNSYFWKELLNKEWFEEIKEVKSIYDLKDWDEYFYINEIYRVRDCEFNKIESQHDLFFWNAFLTKEEAETELKKRKAMANIKKWSHDNDCRHGWKYSQEWEVDYWVILHENKLSWTDDVFVKHPHKTYYSSINKVEQALKELEAEYKILFNIN